MNPGGRGYSLTEVLVVIAVVAILALIAMPRLVVPETVQVRVPARELAADLRLAQRLAIAKRVDYLLEMSPPAPPYTQYTVRSQGGLPEPDFPRDFDAVMTVIGTQQFRFTPEGAVTAAGSVTLTTGGSSAVVQVVAPTGRVTVTP